jgi:energy-coupling factor transport system permease protein
MNKTLLGYVPERSPIYSVHPFVKLFFLLVVSLFPMFISAPEWNVALMATIMLLMIYSRVSLKTLKIYIPVAISMGMIILISYTLLGGVQPQYRQIATVLGVRIYWERLRDAMVVYFRVVPMILSMVFFLSTSRERDLIVAMRTVRVPFVVTYVFAMALRAAGMVLEDFHIVRQAEKARGFDTTGKSLPYRIRKYVMYMIPLFALSLRRTEEFTNALVARGYAFAGEGARVKRADFVLTHYRFSVMDGVYTALIVATFGMILVARFAFQRLTVDDSYFLNWLYGVIVAVS